MLVYKITSTRLAPKVDENRIIKPLDKKVLLLVIAEKIHKIDGKSDRFTYERKILYRVNTNNVIMVGTKAKKNKKTT